MSNTTLWHYRKAGLIPEPDQAGPARTRSYSEQVKDDILTNLPKIAAERQAKMGFTSEKAKALWQDAEYRENVRRGNADPAVRKKRSESARNSLSPEQRKAAGERSKKRWEKLKTRLWRPQNWDRWRPEDQMAGLLLIECAGISNREIGQWLDDKSRLSCPFGHSWEGALTRPGTGANWIAKIRKAVKRPAPQSTRL
jgi:DNA-binding transcriptional MerR regulator